MSDIFISYRRDDSAYVTGRINEHLCSEFGEEAIFTDVDDIPPGVDFRRYIDREVSHCEVLLAVIGPKWLVVTNEHHQRRLDNPADFVRIEIESALRRDIPVIPVLVRGADIPHEDELPESLKALAFRNFRRVRADPDFKNDIHRLVRGLRRLLNESSISAAKSPSGDLDEAVVGLQPGQVFRDKLKRSGEGPEMVMIRGGNFLMGSPQSEQGRFDSEGPQHVVSVQSFAMGRFAVTVSDFQVFVEDTRFRSDVEKGKGMYVLNSQTGEWRKDENANWREPGFQQSGLHPVVGVSWYDAVAYVDWLSTQTGQRYRLPSESEWEYAARAGTTTRYSWGDEILCSMARYGYVSGECGKQASTDPVDSYPANPFGMFGMNGNVWEWTQDCWHDDYVGAPIDGSPWSDDGDCSLHVVRGGGWFLGPDFLRSAVRGRGGADGTDLYRGFRLARDF